MSLSFRRKSPRSLVTLAALSAGALSLGACAHNVATETSLPANGTALLQRMHDRYAGHWYKTLTFVQKTTQYPPNAAPRISTWYESLRGDRLRIDFGNPSAGNGVIYTPDSGYVFRGGKLVRSLADGNIFLPLISSVYVLPMSSTLAQLAPYHFDLSRIRSDTWEGRPTYVVGAVLGGCGAADRSALRRPTHSEREGEGAGHPSREERPGRGWLAGHARAHARRGSAAADGGVHRLAREREAPVALLRSGALERRDALGRVDREVAILEVRGTWT